MNKNNHVVRYNLNKEVDAKQLNPAFVVSKAHYKNASEKLPAEVDESKQTHLKLRHAIKIKLVDPILQCFCVVLFYVKCYALLSCPVVAEVLVLAVTVCVRVPG